MSDRTYERRVPRERAGIRLDKFLAEQPEVATRSAARQILERGVVRVDGVATSKPSLAVEAYQLVTFEPPVFEAPSAQAVPAPELKVLFEDPYLLVIDKPPGLVAHRPEHARVVPPNVADLAVLRCGPLPTLAGEDRPGVVHRLDKDTSGVMVLPKTEEAFHFVRAQFKARTTEKEYRAIAFGDPRFDSDWIERAIATHPQHGDRMTVVTEGGREASTYWEVVERFGDFVDLRCKPRTGRTHQIRVHLMSIGHSIVGDRVYRSRNAAHAALPDGAPDPGRQCLHAERLALAHPHTRERMQFEAAVPEDMAALLRWLRGRG